MSREKSIDNNFFNKEISFCQHVIREDNAVSQKSDNVQVNENIQGEMFKMKLSLKNLSFSLGESTLLMFLIE